MKFAIGIPTLNEADNIAHLVTQIDKAAQKNNIPLVIINADNSSNDGTGKIFQTTPTYNPKVSLTTTEKGKGRNVFAIFEYIASNEDIQYLFLIDGDITSFEEEWLTAQHEQFKKGTDYVLPNYSRKYLEGNGTNHFAYPMMRALLNGPAPRQPIAGDIGLSRGLLTYLLQRDRPKSAYGYGIDIFIAAYAVSYKGTITEIDLDTKIHKPSFPKMTTIFQQETASYFSVREKRLQPQATFISNNITSDFLEAEKIHPSILEARFHEARELYNAYNLHLSGTGRYFHEGILSLEDWVTTLCLHEAEIGKVDAETLAWSLTPFYLLRVVTYLRQTTNVNQAYDLIERQAAAIQQAFTKLHTLT